jgi:hypothetical protein
LGGTQFESQPGYRLGPVSETCLKKYWVMDRVQKLNNPNCNTPSTEPYRIELYNRYGPGTYPSFRPLATHLKTEIDPVSEMLCLKKQY